MTTSRRLGVNRVVVDMREVNDDDDADGERDRWVAARKEEEGIVGHSSDVVGSKGTTVGQNTSPTRVY